MQKLSVFSSKKLTGFILVLAIGLTLLIGQANGSALERIAPQELMSQLTSEAAPVVLDVRSEQEFAEGHIPGAINIPYRQISDRLNEIDEFMAQEIVVYCEVGVRAGIAEIMLEQAGFERIFTLDGDMEGWRQAGLPIDTVLPATAP